MNTKAIEAYNHYKGLYPGALILFHLPERYVSLQDDAGKVSTYLPTIASFESLHQTAVAIPENCLVEAMLALGDIGVTTHIVDYRNDNGELDYPDIKRLTKEITEDY